MTTASAPTILVVDDTEANRYALTRILGSAGFGVHEVETGRKALQAAESLRPHLIVLDVKLPDINGFDVCRMLKENPATRHIPVLQVSASFVRAEDQARGLEGGADGYLTQPVERPVLVATVRSLLRARRAEEAFRQSERRLEEQARELARSNAELEEFASIVSHDLRSPLVSIGGCVQLLMEEAKEKLGEEANELLRLTQDSVNHMGAMIKSLLSYARIGAGGLKLASCDVGAVLSTVTQTLKPRIDQTGAVVTHDALPVVCADETLLTQLLANLLENGLKYHGEAPPRIHLAVDESPGGWTFSVRDNGIGIEPQHLQKVFHMFQRAHADESCYEGTGIGLATCKKIAERHGGRIWVESQPGQGSTFYFVLPRMVC